MPRLKTSRHCNYILHETEFFCQNYSKISNTVGYLACLALISVHSKLSSTCSDANLKMQHKLQMAFMFYCEGYPEEPTTKQFTYRRDCGTCEGISC